VKISAREIFKSIAWLGLSVAVAGVLRYFIQETLTNFSRWLIIGGSAALAVGLAGNFRGVIGFFGRRGTRLGANTLVLAASVLALLVAANVLASRHPKRFDLTEEKLYSLSDQTRKVLSNLKLDVQVMKFDTEDDPLLRDRMAEYRAINKRITYQFVDPQEKPELARQYGVARRGEIVVSSGARTERPADGSEQELTNALLKLTRDVVKNMCFVEGHGEKSPASREEEGLSGVEKGLERENYKVRSVNLVAEGAVPADCSVLVVAGPKREFFPQEVEFVKKFLEGGGRAMLMFDPDTKTNFEDLLKSWRIAMGDDTVLDVSGIGRLFGTGPAVPLVVEYGAHPIAKDFERSMTAFPLARSVKQLDTKSEPVDGISVTELLKTSANSWAETDLKNRTARFDEGKDTRGPISLGVAATKKSGEKEARLVVVGDSDFASNRYAGLQLNADLFFNAMNWLAQDEDLISVRPKSPKNREVTLTQSQQNMMFWSSVVFLPALVLLAGTLIWWRRR
jgi:ABC-type uncharacterized transport system involved in gliding motility auxiliary subunit